MTPKLHITPFSSACKDGINDQINEELTASYLYFAFYLYFKQPNVSLFGTASFFKKHSEEEQCHAKKFIDYLHSRGGNVVLKDIKAPTPLATSLLESFKQSLDLEKQVTQKILALHKLATKENEYHFVAFLEEEFLSEQIEEESKFITLIAQAERVGTGLGTHLFDKELV